jgi:hypothetical protein
MSIGRPKQFMPAPAAEEALHFRFEYFHFITGQDFPIKTALTSDFMQANKGKEFISNTNCPKKNGSAMVELDRMRYYYFHDYIITRQGWQKGT